ncbi:MAG: hypothetical protein Q7T19_02275 [Caulobacter sp.]|nr:hypothetical protein [Caulobacter sp.]
MSRWPNAFFFAASLCILVGANWGLYMSITHDFSTSPAHAHLNLLGWVSLSIMGGFYALLGKDTPLWLVKTNFFLSTAGVVCMITGLGLLFTATATQQQLAPLIAAGSFAVIGGFASFALAVFLSLRLRRATRASLATAT